MNRIEKAKYYAKGTTYGLLSSLVNIPKAAFHGTSAVVKTAAAATLSSDLLAKKAKELNQAAGEALHKSICRNADEATAQLEESKAAAIDIRERAKELVIGKETAKTAEVQTSTVAAS